MSDEYDVLIEISAETVKQAADAREQRDDEIERLRAELAAMTADRDASLNESRQNYASACKLHAERDALRARLKEVANAIEPIAAMAAKFDPPHGYIDQAEWVSVAHLRRARAVYEKIKGGGDE